MALPERAADAFDTSGEKARIGGGSMKRVAIYALPIFATFVAFGLGFLFIRSQMTTFRPRLVELRSAVEKAVGKIGEELEEVVEETLEEART
jgi:hypothetical protein